MWHTYSFYGKRRKITLFNRYDTANVILIEGEKRILIDPGLKTPPGLNSIDEIWITHCHPDHTRSIKHFSSPVYTHPLARKILEAPSPPLALREFELSSVREITKNFTRIKANTINSMAERCYRIFSAPLVTGWRRIKIKGTLEDGEERYGIKILYLPGHTPDGMGYFLPEEKILISGDILIGSIIRHSNLYSPSSDIDQAIYSLEKMLSLSPSIILPGHGRPVFNATHIIKGVLRETLRLREKIFSCFNPEDPWETICCWQRALHPSSSLAARLSSLAVFYRAILQSR